MFISVKKRDRRKYYNRTELANELCTGHNLEFVGGEITAFRKSPKAKSKSRP